VRRQHPLFRQIAPKSWRLATVIRSLPRAPTRLNAFANNHGLRSRFYNLICLAFGTDHVGFADLENYLSPTRLSQCSYEYRTLVRAFDKAIAPHIDQEVAKQVLYTNWLQALQSAPVQQK